MAQEPFGGLSLIHTVYNQRWGGNLTSHDVRAKSDSTVLQTLCSDLMDSTRTRQNATNVTHQEVKWQSPNLPNGGGNRGKGHTALHTVK